MTRSLAAVITVAVTASVLSAQQAPRPPADPRSLVLRGDRFKPLTYDEMTPPQKAMIDHLLAGPRGGANGPFNMLLRSPEIGDLAQQFGGATRFSSSLPQRLYELAILVVAREWSAQYEWYAHRRSGIQAGLSPATADAIAAGRRPTSMPPDETAIYNFATELMETKQVSDATFNAVKTQFGERGVVDLVSVMGWYSTVSMLLNVDRHPLPAGVEPELKPLRQAASR
jgi:4-carboxymuconolactone decarboxylase